MRVDGAATEVVAWRDRVEVGRAAVQDGVAVLALPAGEYSLMARSAATASDVVHGVRSVEDGAEGAGGKKGGGGAAQAQVFDVVLKTRAARRLKVKTEPGARLFWQGVSLPVETSLPVGLHAIVIGHPQRVSSARRLVRLAAMADTGEPVELEMPLERGLLVTGRVWAKAARSTVVPHGRTPLAGARVEVFADGLARDRVATTDAAGRFGLTGFRGRVVSLAVRAPGYAERIVRATFYPGEERARVDVVLRSGSAVRVRADTKARFLLLPAWLDAALGDRRVRPNSAPQDVTGTTAAFSSLRPGLRYRVFASAPGHRPVRGPEFVAQNAGETVSLKRLQLPAGATVRGRAGGAGRTAVCRSEFGVQRCRTDRLGRFRFVGLDAGRHNLFVLDHDERPQEVVLVAGRTLVRNLAGSGPAVAPDGAMADKSGSGSGSGKPAEISGIVFLADGKPAAGVVVSTAGLTVVTDEAGRFSLAPLPRGRRRFTVAARPGSDCRALAADPHLPLREKKVRPGPGLRLRLARAGVLRMVFATGGRPLARARVQLAGASGLRLVRVLPRGAKGLVVHDLPVGPYTVNVVAPGLLGVREAVVQARPRAPQPNIKTPPTPDTVTVLPGRTAAGRVILRRAVAQPGAAPQMIDTAPERGRVVLLDPRPERVFAYTPIEGTDGDFLLEGLPPRPVVLGVACPGRPIAWLAVDLSQGDAEGIEIVLKEGVELAVRVLGENDVSLPDATVRFVTEHGLDVRDLFAWVRLSGYLAADDDIEPWSRLAVLSRAGRFWLPDVHPGSYHAVVRADGYKQLRVGVRARDALARGQTANMPELPRDWASPIRLTRDFGPDPDEENSEKIKKKTPGKSRRD